MNAIDALIAAVEAALRDYDRSGDHAKHSATETDCIRCQLVAALPPPSRERVERSKRLSRATGITIDVIGHDPRPAQASGERQAGRWAAQARSAARDKMGDGWSLIGDAFREALICRELVVIFAAQDDSGTSAHGGARMWRAADLIVTGH